MTIDTKRFAIETDAYGMRRMSPDVLTGNLLDLRKMISNLPFTTPGVVGLRLIAEVDIWTPDPIVVAAPVAPTPPEPAMAEADTEARRRPARAKAKG